MANIVVDSGIRTPLTTMKGALTEPAATNRCLQSNNFNTTWLSAGTGASTQDAIGIDGGLTAWTLTDTSAANTRVVYQNGLSETIGVPSTYSIYIKKTVGAQASYPVFTAERLTNIALCTIDTSNGIATAWTAYTGFTILPFSAVCSSFNDLFWRVTITFTPDATAAVWQAALYIAATTNASQSTGVISAAPTGSCVATAAQFQTGTQATSYIATTTAAVTRAADVATIPVSGNITAAAGSLCIEFTPSVTLANTVIVGVSDGTASNLVEIASTGAGRSQLVVSSAGATVQVGAVDTPIIVAGTTYKIAGSWGGGVARLAVNGVGYTELATSSPVSLTTTIQVGDRAFSSSHTTGNTKNFRTFTRQLTQAELNTLTA